ncbi:MAG TPA: acyl-CoA dehydrogenase family protein [Mizugakiibacter sp.]
MSFVQSAPELGNQYRDDRVLRGYLARALPAALREAIEADLELLGQHAADAWNERALTPRREPVFTPWDAWGNRVDRIALTPAWQEGPGIATRHGLLAAGHDDATGEHARVHQFVLVYLYHVASEFYTCPLAMTDGAAAALKASGNAALIARAVPRFLSRDPATFWLSGQWMTETAGGSDVGHSETEARRGADGQWRLHGRKWFTSAVVGEAALTLARPEGAGSGGSSLAMFYLETHDAEGRWQGVRIDRLKDKLGTRELPTAEIHLDGALATPVGELRNGVRMIAPVLNITRLWNAVCSLATMRRCLALARDYAHRRSAFGRTLLEQPLHVDTLAGMQAEFEAAFHLSFHVAELLGRTQAGVASADEQALLRLLTPLAKLWTGKLAVKIASETLEAFGGMGYLEDTGLPQLLRDAQVYPIWEGTTNVLALDALRVLDGNGLAPWRHALDALLDPTGADHVDIRAAADAAEAWLRACADDRVALEAGARGLALTLARCYAAALLARHAAWALSVQGDRHPHAALQRFLAHGLQRLQRHDLNDASTLASDFHP